jgi:uncharacterized integral membrane protein
MHVSEPEAEAQTEPPEAPEPDSPGEPTAPRADEQASAAESRSDRFRRHGRHARLYAWALLFIALLVVLVGLITANTRKVEVSWVFGDTDVSVAWLVLVTAVVAWLLGIATGTIFRHRTRRRP